MSPLSPVGGPARAMKVAGVVLAAGSSQRLGQPKQLLPFRGTTLLDTTLRTVRRFGLDQLVVTVGGAGPEVQAQIEESGFTVVDSVHHTEGCSSSIVAALARLEPDVDGFLLFLGDQPDVPAAAVEALLAAAEAAEAPLALCRYEDGLGHPFWFRRSLFPDLAHLQGDKAVWKLVASGRWPVTEVAVAGPVPIDVDTWDDYRRLLGPPIR